MGDLLRRRACMGTEEKSGPLWTYELYYDSSISGCPLLVLPVTTGQTIKIEADYTGATNGWGYIADFRPGRNNSYWCYGHRSNLPASIVIDGKKATMEFVVSGNMSKITFSGNYYSLQKNYSDVFNGASIKILVTDP